MPHKQPVGHYQDGGGNWWADAYHKGKRVRRAARDERHARELYHALMSALLHGTPMPKQKRGKRPAGDSTPPATAVNPDGYTVADAFNAYMAQKVRRPCYDSILRSSQRWNVDFGAVLLDDLSRDDVAAWRERRAAVTSNGTANADLAWLKAAIRNAIASRKAKWDATLGLKRLPVRSRRARLRPGQGDQLLAALPSDQDRRLVVFVINTGLRRGNACSVEWAWVDWESALLEVPMTKSGHPLTIPLNSVAMEVLRAQCAVTGGGRHVWLNRDGRPVKGESWWLKILRPAMEACGLIAARAKGEMPTFRTHDLRHTFGTAATKAGVGLQATKELLGHSSIAMTDQYSHLDLDDLRSASEATAWRPTVSFCKTDDKAEEDKV